MHCTRKVTEDLYWIGGSDRRLALFENIYPIPRGVAYNAYVLLDEKTVLFDTVDYSIGRQMMENLEYVLNGRTLDYVVINHMEPDHCAMLEQVIMRYPEVTIISNAKAFGYMQQFFNFDLEGRTLVVKEGDTFCSGAHTMAFVMAPMVHWPEAMVTFDVTSQILFAADAFGSFGALDGHIFADEIDFDRDWLDDARRYFTNIVGKYGPQVQAVLKKAGGLDIKMICPLHGPIWREDLGYIISKYDKWSRYEEEEKGVVIAYASMYGNTEAAAAALACKLADKGVRNIKVCDLSVTHVSYMIADIFKYSHLVLASPTYNNEMYPKMEELLMHMKGLAVQNKTVAIMENGTWAPTAGKKIRAAVEGLKNMTILEESVTMKSALKETQDAELTAMADAIAASVNA